MPKERRKREPDRELTPLELELREFQKVWNSWWEKYYAARDAKFKGFTRDEPPGRRREVAKFDVQYEKENPRPSIPLAIAMDLDGGTTNVAAKLDSGYFSSDKVVVFKEKHGERHFLLPANDIEAHGRVALNVVKDREGCGFYGHMKAGDEPKPPDTTREQAAAMPEKYRKLALDEWAAYGEQVKDHKKALAENELLAKAIAGDPMVAVKFLRGNRGGEYEGYDVIVPERA
jgi:hypothetical protein